MEETTLKASVTQASEEWVAKFMTNRRAYWQRRKLNSSGTLINSIEFDTDSGKADVVSILIGFEGYGRILEMKNVSHDKWGRNAISRVEDWIKRKGVQAFVPGFLEKYGYKSPPVDIVNRIAWGILKSPGKGRSGLWAKPKSAAVSDLYNDVAAASLKGVSQDSVKFFKEYSKVKGRE